MNTEQTPTESLLGNVRNHGFDAEGYERREELVALLDCSRCGKVVELWDSTTEWVKDSKGRCRHNQYSGCGTGICCGLLFVDDWNGCRVFDL
jgi:hypothetical protein